MNEIAEYTQKIEELLEQQKAENKKLKKQQRIQSVLLIIFTGVFAIGMLMINISFSKASKGLPELVDTTTQSVEDTSKDIQRLLKDINAVDFENINKTIEDAGQSINELDIETLNKSISSLEKVVSKLSDFFGL